MGGGYCSGYYNAHVVRHPRQRYTRTIQFERKKGHRRSINDDLMFIYIIETLYIPVTIVNSDHAVEASMVNYT